MTYAHPEFLISTETLAELAGFLLIFLGIDFLYLSWWSGIRGGTTGQDPELTTSTHYREREFLVLLFRGGLERS